MMVVMQARLLAVTGFLVASIAGLAVSTFLYIWPGAAPAPHWLPDPKMEALVVPAYPLTIRSVEMRRGDTLAQALTRGGLPARAATALATQFGKNGADLRRIRAGATIEITWNARNEPMTVRYEASPWLSFAARPLDGGWRVGRAETLPELRVEVVKGVVQRSLFDAVERTGESARLVLALVEIFSSDFDFTADTRAGDRFRLLVEKRYAGEAFVDYGRILVAQYASGGNGIQLHIRHRSGYETQYNHLSRVASDVRPGTRVRQKQIIGNVGATGLATGPHLDYRVAHNGTFVNPLSEKFIPGEPIPAAARADFNHQARERDTRLETAAPN